MLAPVCQFYAELSTMAERQRKPRFSAAELRFLREGVVADSSKLFGKDNASVKERKRLWDSIVDNVNAVSTVKRTAIDCQKRWNDDKRVVKKKASKYHRESQRTGGGTCEGVLTQEEEAVLSTVPVESVQGLGGHDTSLQTTSGKKSC